VAVGEELQQESASFSQLQHREVGSTAYQDVSCGRRWRRQRVGDRRGGVEGQGNSGRCRVGVCGMGEEDGRRLGRDEVAVDVINVPNSNAVGKAGALGCCWPHPIRCSFRQRR